MDIFIKKGAHNTENESKYNQLFFSSWILSIFFFAFLVNKQINDKERIAAAMENPSLSELVEKCIKDEE